MSKGYLPGLHPRLGLELQSEGRDYSHCYTRLPDFGANCVWSPPLGYSDYPEPMCLAECTERCPVEWELPKLIAPEGPFPLKARANACHC